MFFRLLQVLISEKKDPVNFYFPLSFSAKEMQYFVKIQLPII